MPRKPNPNANPVTAANGRLGVLTRMYGEDSPQVEAARIESTTVRIEETIRRLVAQAPPLPEENRRRIAAVLNSAVAA